MSEMIELEMKEMNEIIIMEKEIEDLSKEKDSLIISLKQLFSS